jgi:hypothetical protein
MEVPGRMGLSPGEMDGFGSIRDGGCLTKPDSLA